MEYPKLYNTWTPCGLSKVIYRFAKKRNMGINIEQWRCQIGTFSHAANTFERDVAYIEVAVCTSEHENFTIFPEGIEANPGPESTNF